MEATPELAVPVPTLSLKLVLYFWRYLRPDVGILIVAFIGLAAQAAFSVLITLVPTILERNWRQDRRNYLYFAIGGLLIVNLVILLIQSVVNWMMSKCTENVVRRVKLAILKKVGSLPSEDMTFESVGNFTQRTTGDVMQLGGMIYPGLMQVMFSSAQLIFMLGALFYIDYRYAWVLPVVSILVFVMVLFINEKVRFWARKDQLKQQDILTQFIETIGGCRDLIASGRFSNALDAYDVELASKQRYVIRSAAWNNLGGMLPTACFAALIFSYYLFKIAGTNFSEGASEVGPILSYAANLGMAQGLFMSLFKLSTDAALATPSLHELHRLLNADEVVDQTGKTEIATSHIVFDKVQFGYGHGKRLRKELAKPVSKSSVKWILQNLSFKIEPGTFVAVVGQSGSGKTTLFYMLLRLLEPADGVISLGGVPLDSIPLRLLHNYIGFIPQAPFIFSASIRANLLMGATDGEVPEARIEHAIKMAKLEDLIAKRKEDGGLDAQVGAGGASLSAGERQRIALARIFLRNPSVIVCDEYTANIDNATAKLIHDSIRNEFKGKTRMVITHQLYTVKGADLIFVIDEGRITDQGTHDQLVSREGLYRDMWEVQKME